jgi:hypothetical protein
VQGQQHAVRGLVEQCQDSRLVGVERLDGAVPDLVAGTAKSDEALDAVVVRVLVA